jgi:ElaB/YqjD/DUF883 family membrane-anchored ribosome-binding protein
MSKTSDRPNAKAKTVSNELKEMATGITGAAEEKLDQIRDSATEFYEQGRDKIYGAESAIEQYVRERPVKSILIAAGIGLVFGRFFMRR